MKKDDRQWEVLYKNGNFLTLSHYLPFNSLKKARKHMFMRVFEDMLADDYFYIKQWPDEETDYYREYLYGDGRYVIDSPERRQIKKLLADLDELDASALELKINNFMRDIPKVHTVKGSKVRQLIELLKKIRL